MESIDYDLSTYVDYKLRIIYFFLDGWEEGGLERLRSTAFPMTMIHCPLDPHVDYNYVDYNKRREF